MKEAIISYLVSFFGKRAPDFNIEMAFLYGSYARGYPREDSDVDIAIVFTQNPPGDVEGFRTITDISLEISSSLGKEINILPIYEDFRKPMLYYNAIVLSIPLYINERERYTKLKLEAIRQMEDFSLFGVMWQLEIARKNLEVLYG